MKKLRELMAKKAAAVKASRELLDKAEAEGRDLNEEEVAAFDKLQGDIVALQGSIDRETLMVSQESQIEAGRVLGPIVPAPDAEAGMDRRGGFANLGEFAQSVMQASINPGNRDGRLAAAPTTYGNEGAGADGGFAIPPEFSEAIWRLSLGEDSLVPMTQNTEVTGNSMIFPKDETTPWGGNGVQAYWQNEAAQAAQSKPQLGSDTLVLHKLMVLVPITNELLADAAAIGSYLGQVAPERITWKTNEAILFGDGAGKPFGALTNAGSAGSPAIVQAKDAGQAANTITNINISNMVSRLLVGQLKNAFWLVTPDLLSPMEGMSVGNYPIYLPNNSVEGSSYGSLKGRPVMLSEHAAALSSQSDISLLSLKGYRTITKAGGIQTATSMHLFFDADATAFRFTFRINGKPLMTAPVTPPKSANTRSHFVTLAAR